MKITPVIKDYFNRYRISNNKIIDTVTGIEYIQPSKLKAEELLKRLNEIGMQNARVIDTGKGNAQLLSVVA